MAMNMAEFRRLADPDLDAIWFENETELEEQYSKVMKVVGQPDLYSIEAQMAGFDTFQEITEGEDVTYDEAIAPRERRYDLVKRGRGYKITDKLWKFDRYREVEQFERALMRADRADTEKYFMGLFNNATATTVSTGFDGLALASTAHVRMDGGAVQANRPTVLTALSLTALQDAYIAFRQLLDERGRPYDTRADTLLIRPDLIITAREILESQLDPNTANNTVNVVNSLGLKLVENFYLTGSTFWALMDSMGHDIKARWNERPVTSSDEDFDSETIKRKVVKWMGRGHGDWRGYWQGNT